jgi:hypothetical protein
VAHERLSNLRTEQQLDIIEGALLYLDDIETGVCRDDAPLANFELGDPDYGIGHYYFLFDTTDRTFYGAKR